MVWWSSNLDIVHNITHILVALLKVHCPELNIFQKQCLTIQLIHNQTIGAINKPFKVHIQQYLGKILRQVRCSILTRACRRHCKRKNVTEQRIITNNKIIKYLVCNYLTSYNKNLSNSGLHARIRLGPLTFRIG